MKTVTHIKPDVAMVYAVLLIRLRDGARSMPVGKRAKLRARLRRIGKTLTDYEREQAHKLASPWVRP